MACMASYYFEEPKFPNEGGISSETELSGVSLPSSIQRLSNDTGDSNSNLASPEIDVLVAGSLAIDLSCDYVPIVQRVSSELGSSPVAGTSNPAIISQSLGGVGQNLATGLFYLGTSVSLCSAVGNDAAGKVALATLHERKMQTDDIEIIKDGARTAQYVAFNDIHKDLVIAMADMSILDKNSSEFLKRWKPHLDRHRPKWLVLDANWNADTLQEWTSAARALGMKIAYEPVSEEKSGRIFESHVARTGTPQPLLDLATPNERELQAMWTFCRPHAQHTGLWPDDVCQGLTQELNSCPVDQKILRKALDLLLFIQCVLTTLGSRGILMTELLYSGDPRLTDHQCSRYILKVNETLFSSSAGTVAGAFVKHFPPIEKVSQDQIVSVNGVGDTFLGIIVAGLAKENPKSVLQLIDIAQKGAVMTLKSKESVSPEIETLSRLL